MPKQPISERQIFEVNIDNVEMRRRRESDAQSFDNITNKFLERFHASSN